MTDPSPNARRVLRTGKIAISLTLFAYCLSIIDVARLGALVRNANVAALVPCVALVIIETIIGAYRFKLLFDCVQRLNFRTHVFQYFAAGYFNLVLPSSMGGDAARVLWLGRAGISRTAALTVILIERIMGVYTLVIVSVAAAWHAELPDIVERLIAITAVLAICSLLLLILLYRLIQPRPPALRDAFAAVQSVFSRRSRVVSAVLASLVYQFATVAVTFLVVLAFNLQVPTLAVFALVPLVWFATFVPIGIGGLGVREASFIFLFAYIGVGQETALTMSLGTYAAFAAAGIVGGAWFTMAQTRPPD